MKNKFRKIGLNRVLEIVSELLSENNTRSLNITSDLSSTLGHGKYDWVFLNENELLESDLEFKELVLDNIKDLIVEGGTDVVIKRELDSIIVKCFSIHYLGVPFYETTIRCNSYITSTLVHNLIEKMYLENGGSVLYDNDSLMETIKSIYACSGFRCKDRIELSFSSKSNIIVKKINILNDK